MHDLTIFFRMRLFEGFFNIVIWQFFAWAINLAKQQKKKKVLIPLIFCSLAKQIYEWLPPKHTVRTHLHTCSKKLKRESFMMLYCCLFFEIRPKKGLCKCLHGFNFSFYLGTIKSHEELERNVQNNLWECALMCILKVVVSRKKIQRFCHIISRCAAVALR